MDGPENRIIGDGLTFDDVLLVPSYSEVIPSQVDVSSFLTPEISLNIPFCSAAMDTVTESRLAIALAREGGIGIIHRNMSWEKQVAEVDKVKRSESGVIVDPFYLHPEDLIKDAVELMDHYHISGVPIVDERRRLVGIITNRDLRFVTDYQQPISGVMTREKLVTAPVGTDLEGATKILMKHKIEKLPIVDRDGTLKGLITIKDIQKARDFPQASKDSRGRLRVGAALGVGDGALERAGKLVEAGIDVLVVDTAHGHSRAVVETVRLVRREFPGVALVGGNIATGEAAEAGIGIPQLSAVMRVAEVAHSRGKTVIADGGIRYSGDVVKAVAAGADSVMIGSLFAGTDESPGEVVIYRGRSFKSYRGMGSLGAMKGGESKDRYFQEGQEEEKLVPEGIEGLVPYKGPMSAIAYQLVGGLRSGMGYVGASNIEGLQRNAKFVRITGAGVKESHPHDVVITKEAPNYHLE